MTQVQLCPAGVVDDLRNEIAGLVGLVAMVGGVLLLWSTLVDWPFPMPAAICALLLSAIGLVGRELARRHISWSRYVLVTGLALLVLAAMWIFGDERLPLAGVLLVLIATPLFMGGGVAVAALVAALAAWLNAAGYRTYDVVFVAGLLGSAVILSALILHQLLSALQWAEKAWQRADRLFEESSKRQVELNETLKSLDLANELQQRTQYELAVARKRADEARRMKEMFAANISHELRTPLNLILGFSELMYKTPEVYGDAAWPVALRRDVFQVYSASRHLMEMINDILDLSRFEMTGFTLNREITPLRPFLQDTMAIVADLFRGHPARLETQLADDLPELELDRTRIRQVLLNLFANAKRFTDGGCVRLEARVEGDEVLITVADTGAGIPADRLPLIFDEFYQVDSSLRRKREGVGLGLAISKRFVEAHEGRIWVESKQGRGSRFVFALPFAGRRNAAVLERDGTRMGEALPRARLLVVDPDPGVTELIARHLTEYDVLPVLQADRLDEEIAQKRPRAVLDNRPANEAAAATLPQSTSVPVFRCSLPGRAWTIEDMKVAACLYKPVTEEQLDKELERLGPVGDVLIIDDDRGFVQLVERMLQATGRGYRTLRAYDGTEGLELMRQAAPGAVLLDLIMPEMDGAQVLAEMRKDAALSSIPVVLLSATSPKEERAANRDLVISRHDGLRMMEVLRCLEAVIPLLEPHYDDGAFLDRTPRQNVRRSLSPGHPDFG